MFAIRNRIKIYAELLRKNKVVNPYIFMSITALFVISTFIVSFTWEAQDVAISITKSTIVLFLYLLTFFFVSATALKLLSLLPRFRRHSMLVLITTFAFFLVCREVCLYFQIPRLLFSTVYFSCCTPGLYAQSLGVLFVDISLVVFLSTIALKYLTFVRYRKKFLRNRYVTFGILFLYLASLLLIFYGIVFVIARLVGCGNYMVNPDKMLFFDAYSVVITFMFFAMFYAFALLIHKATRLAYYFFQKDIKKIFLFSFSALVVVGIVACLFFPDIQGLPFWIVLSFLVVYLTMIIVAVVYNKNNFQFISVVSNIILFSALTALLLSFYVEQKEADNRKEFINSLISNKPILTHGDTISKEVLNDVFNEIYATNNPPTCSWICKSSKYLNRPYINQYAKLTTQYSFAYFVDNHLVDQYGQYDYKLNAKDYIQRKEVKSPDLDYVVIREYQHYIYRINDSEVIIISQREDANFGEASAFSFFFIAFTFYYFIIYMISRIFMRMRRKTLSLYNRLLWTSLTVLLIISLIVCTLSLHYYMKSSSIDRREQVMGKMGAIQLRFIKDEGSYEDLLRDTSIDKNEINASVEKLSNTFLVNVNLYDTLGYVMFTSDPKLPSEYQKLPPKIMAHFKQDYSYFFNEAFIGNKSIYSVYKTITDRKGQVIGYFNINDVKNRYARDVYMSALISKYLRTYTIIIFLSLLASWLIYYFVSKPMGYLGRALSKNKQQNKLIRLNWADNEEIGQLIREHNRMVEELRINAEMLAKSERETAWREMAMEIAHEIKNPLTPMKLKMQMLQKAWQENREDFDLRIKNVSQLILSQIDILTEVADTFSEFAETQQSVNGKENLKVILDEEQDCVQNNLNTTYIFNYDRTKDYHASVDKKLFQKMLSYLRKNAEHNRQEDGKLQITFNLGPDEDERYWLLAVSSNDRGLDNDDTSLVFTVKFSSGNCGHSLCLPIVKNIVVGFGGEISLTTEKNKGTEFFIRIPKL